MSDEQMRKAFEAAYFKAYSATPRLDIRGRYVYPDQDAFAWFRRGAEAMQLNKTQTCDKCQHYTPADPEEDDFKGMCRKAYYQKKASALPNNVMAGWSFAGVYVGPKFGCIHWEQKA